MINGRFEIEEDDIVRLQVGTFGWVNIGAHAVEIGCDDEGNLRVRTYARTDEDESLAGFDVTDKEARAKGGRNPDQE